MPPASAQAHVLDASDISMAVPEPGAEDYKYSRGVVGIAAGSRAIEGRPSWPREAHATGMWAWCMSWIAAMGSPGPGG